MHAVQRAAKGLALALAFFLICVIISAIVGAGLLAARIFDWDGDTTSSTTEIVEVGNASENAREGVERLNIMIGAAQVMIEQGDEFSVKANEGLVTVRRDHETLSIQENDFDFFGNWDTERKVQIVIPREWNDLRGVQLKTGAGSVKVRGLAARNLKIELGAGKAELDQLVVTERAEIDSGAGHLLIRESRLANLDLDMGAGKVELGAELSGDNRIDAGVGKLELDLVGEAGSYRFKIDKGIGSITLNGESFDDDVNEVGSTGDVLVEIDGGVGAIEIHSPR